MSGEKLRERRVDRKFVGWRAFLTATNIAWLSIERIL
jgi:hypothetical protein